jgi:CzcA family heavy metal efflux pump
MMRWIVGWSLKFRRLVVALAAGTMIFGITQLRDTPVDVLPEFSPPTVEIQTEALGLSAPEVEQLITAPMEQTLLNGVAFLDVIRSESVPGLSSIELIFEPGTDLLDARQVVAERLTQAYALPNVSKPPQMLQPLSSTSRVLMVRLSSETLSLIDISVLARWVIGPRLLGVDGVANVAIWGQRERQLQVQVDPERLRAQRVSLAQIIRTAGNALEVSPLSFLEASTPGTGGWIDTSNQRLHIFHEQAISTPEELAQVTIEDRQGGAVFVAGEALTLGEVTEVVEDHQPLIGDAICRNGECLLLVVEKFPDANTPEVTRDVDAALDALRPGLPGLEVDSTIYRPARFIEASFLNLRRALWIGAILLAAVIGACFFQWRTALILAVVIPLSVVAAAVVLHLRGVTLNAMILAGLVMALVAIVDEAVIDVESMARRIRGRAADGDGGPFWRSVLSATLETRTAMVYAALVVFAALLPFLFMEGEAGAFLPPLVLTFVLAVAASTVVALTVTPALSAILLAGAPLARQEPPAVRWLQRRYDRLAPRIVHRPGPAFIAAGGLVVAGLVALPFLHLSLRPSLKERDVLVHLEAASGTSLPRMREVTARAVRELASLPGVLDAGAHVGRAVMSDRTVNVNAGDIWVSVDPSADYDATVTGIDDLVDGYPGLSHEVLTYSEERVTEALQGTDDEVVIRVYGEDPEVLRSKADELRTHLSGIDGVEGARVELAPQEPALEVEVDLARARAFGVKPGDVRRAAATLLSGITVGHLFEEQKVFDVVVWGRSEIRQGERDVRELLIETPDGGHVRLGQVADVRMAPNPTVIRHESVSTYVDVRADVKGRDVGAVAGDVDRALERVEFPLEHHAELLGGFADQRAARSRVIAVAVAAAIGILLLLQAAFASWRLALLALVALPTALVGGVLSVVVAGSAVTLGSIAGFIAVLGIAVRGSVVTIGRYQRLERREGQPFGPDLVVSGTREGLPAALTTALATGLFLFPFVLAGDPAGLEIVRPMAVVVVGGLVTSTVVNLLVLPALYLRYGSVAKPDAWDEDLLVARPDVDLVGR